MDYQKFTHKTPHLKGKKHQLDPNLDLKQLVHHATVQYVDRDADGDVDVYDNPKKKVPDESPGKEHIQKSTNILMKKEKGEIKHSKKRIAFESTSSGEDIDEGLVGKLIDKVKGRKVIGKTGSGGNIYVSTRNKSSKVAYKSSAKPKQPEKKTSEIDHDDPWLKHSSGAEKKAHYRQLRGESTTIEDLNGNSFVEVIDLIKPNKLKVESTEEKRYCPLCDKREGRSECSYGEKAWDKVSVKDEEYSMARSELNTIHNALKRLEQKVGKGEGNLEAWVQSKITKAADYIDTAADYLSGDESGLEEAVRIPTKNGNLLMVVLTWKGSTYALRVFFPQSKIPNRREVEEQIQKVYPGSKVTHFKVIERQPGEPFLQIEDWQSVNRNDKTDGLSQKAVNAYRRENPGSKLQTAVTEKKPTGKRADRRKSFCRRMKGMKSKLTSAKTSRDPDSRINKALRRWNCN
jgi:hypothetical protein